MAAGPLTTENHLPRVHSATYRIHYETRRPSRFTHAIALMCCRRPAVELVRDTLICGMYRIGFGLGFFRVCSKLVPTENPIIQD